MSADMYPIKILFLSPKPEEDKYGILELNKSLMTNLRVVDENAERIHIIHAVMEEDSKIPAEERDEAEAQRIQLLGATFPRGRERLPVLEEIDIHCRDYFRAIGNMGITHVVGHIPHLANAALSMAELVVDKMGTPPIVTLAAHFLPVRETTREIDNEKLCDWLYHSDVVLSIGHDVFDKVTLLIDDLQISARDKPANQLYLQGAPIEFFQWKPNQNIKLYKVLTLPSESQQAEARGYNYKLAVEAAAKALDFDEDDESRQLFTTIGASDEEKEIWQEHFNQAYQEVEAR